MLRHGDVLSRPDDCINQRHQHPLDREILLVLYRARNYKLSSMNIQRFCTVKHIYGGEEKQYAVRHIEGRLKLLVEKGDVDRENADNETGSTPKGRPTYLFSISDKCKNEIEKYMRTAEPEMSTLIKAHIVDLTPDGLRVQALEKLAAKGDQAASDELIQMLSTEPNANARLKAVRALGRLHEIRAIEQLKRACNDPAESVRGAAAMALEKLVERSS